MVVATPVAHQVRLGRIRSDGTSKSRLIEVCEAIKRNLSEEKDNSTTVDKGGNNNKKKRKNAKTATAPAKSNNDSKKKFFVVSTGKTRPMQQKIAGRLRTETKIMSRTKIVPFQTNPFVKK